ITAPADKAVNWRPIGFAQLRKRIFRLRSIGESGLCYDAPVRGGKTCPALLERSRGRFHGASLPSCHPQWQHCFDAVPVIKIRKALDPNAITILEPDFFWGNLCETPIYCAQSSKAAGSPCRCARTSPAKCKEPVIRIGFG